MKLLKDYYVYIYYRLDTNEPFYVGKGKDDRWKRLNEATRGHNKHFMNIINKIPIAVIIEKDNLTESEAFYWEEKIINKLVFEYGFSIDIKGNRSNEHYCHLVNKTWGGEGASGCNSYENKTEEEMKEIKKKLSEASKGENNPMYGKDWREGKTEEEILEHNRRISESIKGEKHPWWGRHHTEETRKKQSEAKKGKYDGKNHPGAKSVICLTTKKIFFTAKEGAKYYNIKSSSNIMCCCKGCGMNGRGNKVKYHFAGRLPDGTKLVWRYIKWNHNKKFRIK